MIKRLRDLNSPAAVDPKSITYSLAELAQIFGTTKDFVALWVVENKLPPPDSTGGELRWSHASICNRLMLLTTTRKFFEARPPTHAYPTEETAKIVLKTLIDLTLLKKE